MSHAFEFEVTALFAVGNLVVDVDLEDSATAQLGCVALFELLQLRSAPNSDRGFLSFVALAPCGLRMAVRPRL